jgi:hypothetical protein
MRRYASFAALALLAASVPALAQDPRQFDAVVCVSQAGAQWTERARGTLTRVQSADVLAYELKAGEHTLTWRFVSSPPDGTTVVGPGFLLDVFAVPETKEWPERRQNLYADGEIREYAPSSALVLLVGSKCPGAKKATRPARLQV